MRQVLPIGGPTFLDWPITVQNLILVVDDDPAICDILTDLLFAEGYRVQCAANGQDALEFVAAEPPAVIVSDIRMPKVDGVAMVKGLRDAGYDMPVVLTSSWTPPPDIGGMRFVAKPFDLADMSEAVKRSVEDGQ